MKKTPERIELLAAEYVLGSLHGRARKRFERWLMESARVREEVWFWPGWSAVATAAALILAVLLVQPSAPPSQASLSGAIVQADIGDPLWLVSESVGRNLLKLRSVAATAPGTGKDYELWIVPENGQPLSLGVIPAGGACMRWC